MHIKMWLDAYHSPNQLNWGWSAERGIALENEKLFHWAMMRMRRKVSFEKEGEKWFVIIQRSSPIWTIGTSNWSICISFVAKETWPPFINDSKYLFILLRAEQGWFDIQDIYRPLSYQLLDELSPDSSIMPSLPGDHLVNFSYLQLPRK